MCRQSFFYLVIRSTAHPFNPLASLYSSLQFAAHQSRLLCQWFADLSKNSTLTFVPVLANTLLGMETQREHHFVIYNFMKNFVLNNTSLAVINLSEWHRHPLLTFFSELITCWMKQVYIAIGLSMCVTLDLSLHHYTCPSSRVSEASILSAEDCHTTNSNHATAAPSSLLW